MTFNLASGHRVRTMPLPDGKTEFETSNPEGRTISTVVLSTWEAQPLLAALRRSR